MSLVPPTAETAPNEIVLSEPAGGEIAPAAPAEIMMTDVIGGPELPSALDPSRQGLSGPGLWLRVGLVLILFTASAVARQWQSTRVNQTLRDGRIAPFALEEIPDSLGEWEKVNSSIDPHITRSAGAVDSAFRTYQHRRTGQKVDLIALFGPSTEMYIHTPDNCYKAGGYAYVSGPILHQIPIGKKSVPFFSSIYARGEAGTVEREEVYWTWHYSGQWTPNLVTQKGFERIPGMFKVHIQRSIKRASELDLLDIGNPTEAFLKMLMPEIDSRIAKTMHRTTSAKTTSSVQPKKS